MLDPFEAYTAHVNPVLGRFLRLTGRDLRLVRARGCALLDADGRRFDDWVAGFGSLNLGHNPEAIVEAIRRHLDEAPPGLFPETLNPYAGALAERLVAAAGAERFETCFFCNSGSEAVEAALKTACAATGRRKVIHAEGAYHGTTLGALSCTARDVFRAPFEGLLATGFVLVPFGDAGALEEALAPGDAAAFIVEPVQVEAGVRIAGDAYLRRARELCRRAGALLILDEVQTGMGRTGALFAFQHAGPGAEPDILVLAKALGGGLVPAGAAVYGRGLFERAYGGALRCEAHNSTFGGNALAARVALETLETIARPDFLEGVRRRAEELFGALAAALAGRRLVERISWRGLLGGVKLAPVDHPWLRFENLGLPELAGRPVAGPIVVDRLLRKGIVAQVCGHDWSVVRVEPPLVVDAETCGRFVDAFAEAVSWLEGNA